MKKFVALILCLMLLLTLISCNVNEENDSTQTESTTTENKDSDSATESEAENDDENEISDGYSRVIELYRHVVNFWREDDGTISLESYAAELGIVEAEEQELFRELYSAAHLLLYPGRTTPKSKALCGYAIKDLNGDGIDELVLINDYYMVGAVFSFADGKPVLLGSYIQRGRCWIDADGQLHENGNSGADYSTNAIYKISEGGASLQLVAEFGTNGHEWIGDVAVTKYYQLLNGEKVDITKDEYVALGERYGEYLGYYECAEATEKYSGLEYVPLFEEADIAMAKYERVLQNEEKIIAGHQYIYLKECSVYPGIPLEQAGTLYCAYVDVDKDGISELFVSCGDMMLFRYYNGDVYMYDVTVRHADWNTDGSYAWNSNKDLFEYGETQFYFDGAKLKDRVLWKIVNDGEPNAEYYIGGEQVTEAEMTEYFKDNPKTKIEFSPLDLPWQNKVSWQEALDIAAEYWNIKSGDVDPETGFPYAFLPKNSRDNNYCVALSWLVDGHHYSTLDTIEIDPSTGEIILPTYDFPDGK